MRVLVVFSSSELGGAERSLTRMALAAAGDVEFSLATLDGHGPWTAWCQEMGAVPIVLGRRSRSGSHGHFGFGAIARLVGRIRRDRFDAVYLIGLRASVLVRLVKPLLRGARLVHGVRWNPGSNSRLDRAFRIFERLLQRQIDLYICNSRAAAKTLESRVGIPESKIAMIHNGLDYLPARGKPLSNRPMRVVTVANLSPRKGHLEFLDVIEEVLRRQPRAQFVFIGRDDMAGRLDKEVERRGLQGAVTMAGFQADVGSWLGEARLMVLPSLWAEGCPTSILEAYAYGVPVVAYAIDGVPELIENEEDGILVRPRDQIGLANALVRLLEDEALAQRMASAGRAKVESRFSVDRCAQMHNASFARLMSNSGQKEG